MAKKVATEKKLPKDASLLNIPLGGEENEGGWLGQISFFRPRGGGEVKGKPMVRGQDKQETKGSSYEDVTKRCGESKSRSREKRGGVSDGRAKIRREEQKMFGGKGLGRGNVVKTL